MGRDVCCHQYSSSCTQQTVTAKRKENVMIKFIDDTSLSGIIQDDDSSCREAMEESTEWCDRNYLELIMTKIKELIYFRIEKSRVDPIIVRVQPVEVVENYKYLGTIVNSRLDWSSST